MRKKKKEPKKDVIAKIYFQIEAALDLMKREVLYQDIQSQKKRKSSAVEDSK